MPDKGLTIAFPTGGLDRRLSFQAQKPYTTPDAANVIPGDPLLYRDRGGTRPCLTKYSANSWNSRFRCLSIFTSSEGVRSLIGATVSGGVSYSTIAGGTASNGAGLSTTGRVQCTQMGNSVFFVGSIEQTKPVTATYDSTGAVTAIAAVTFSSSPAVAFPNSYPLAVAVKYNRLFLAYHGDSAGTAGRPNRWWASEVDTPLAMGAYDAADPTSSYTAELNDTNDQITAIIPWFGDYLIFATGSSLYVLDGDPHPLSGGRMRRVSSKVGILDNSSWCIGEDNTIVAMSNSGPILLSPSNPLGEPTFILRDKLPGVLSRPDVATYDYALGFDSRSRRVQFAVSKLSATAGIVHYTLDLGTQSWWPVKYANTDHEPFAFLPVRELSSGRSDLILGCRDGYLRYFDETATSDDGTALASYVWLGPFRANDPRSDGSVSEVVGTMATSSGSVTWELYLGRNAEEAYNAAIEWPAGTWAAGRNPPDRPRMRCGTFFLKISASAGRWAFEEAFVKTVAGGLQRS